jgi:hypothetical protein
MVASLIEYNPPGDLVLTVESLNHRIAVRTSQINAHAFQIIGRIRRPRDDEARAGIGSDIRVDHLNAV